MPVIAQGLDYSARRLSGASIKAAGYKFANRYLWFKGQRWPSLTPEELIDLEANGIEVNGIYEENTNDPAGGFLAGQRMAATAANSAVQAGMQPGDTVFMCADSWLANHGISIATAMEFLDGARPVLHRAGFLCGAYGFADFVFAAHDGGHADRFWLCGAEIPDDHRPDWLHMYQWNNGRVYVDGLECDLNKQYLPMNGEEMSTDVVRDGLSLWLKNELAPGTDQRALLQNLFVEAEIEVIPDEGEPWKDRLGAVIAAIDRRLVRVETLAAALKASGIPVEAKVDWAAGVKAINDDRDKRERDGDPKTGSPS